MQIDKEHLIARGRTAEVYQYGPRQVIKLLYNWCPPEWASREVQIAKLVHSRGLPVPKCEGLVEHDGRQGVIFERAQGPSMFSVIGRKPWTMKKNWTLLAELHARIHSQDGNGFASLHQNLQHRISSSRWVPQDIRAPVLSLLAGLEDGTSLCHFDFHPDQVVLSSSGPIILDWMTAFRGAAAADLARTMVIMTFGIPPDPSWLMQQGIRLARVSFRRHYLREYNRLQPAVDRQAVENWMVPVAAARLTEEIEAEREALLAFLRQRLQTAGA